MLLVQGFILLHEEESSNAIEKLIKGTSMNHYIGKSNGSLPAMDL